MKDSDAHSVHTLKTFYGIPRKAGKIKVLAHGLQRFKLHMHGKLLFLTCDIGRLSPFQQNKKKRNLKIIVEAKNAVNLQKIRHVRSVQNFIDPIYP